MPIDLSESPAEKLTFGSRVADKIAEVIGGWPFILIQSSLIAFWVIANTVGIANISKWDPFPFIFLNLTLSFQAAYTAPIIMMSQNRQEKRDRFQAKEDHEINKLAETEIKEVQEKLEEISAMLKSHINNK